MNKTKYNRKYNTNYNYNNGMRCNDMKPMERKFFRYIIRQIDYKELSMDQSNTATIVRIRETTVGEYANRFSTKYNVPYKQLMYYLSKWSVYGFYQHGVSLHHGLFDIKIITGECSKPSWQNYIEAVPERVKRQVNSILSKG